MKRLVLIDGHAIIHRAFHALPPMTAPNGDQVNAVYGFTSMLFRIIDQLKPTHIAVAFDLPQATFRRTLYIAYQANRPHTDDSLMKQFQYVREVVEAAGIPGLSVGGFEADDIIGTLAKRYAKKQMDEVIIVTGDRDMMQLVNKKVKLYMPVKGLSEAKIVDAGVVKDYWGVTPEQIVDLKALIGDSSDNYPGVPGVGPKTASTLLQKFKTLENIYKNIDSKDIPEKVRTRLKDGYESALLSQKLAQIEIKVPLKFELAQAKVTDFKTSEPFIRKLQQLSFRSLITRVGAEKVVKKIEQKDKGQMELLD